MLMSSLKSRGVEIVIDIRCRRMPASPFLADNTMWKGTLRSLIQDFMAL